MCSKRREFKIKINMRLNPFIRLFSLPILNSVLFTIAKESNLYLIKRHLTAIDKKVPVRVVVAPDCEGLGYDFDSGIFFCAMNISFVFGF